MSAGKKPVNLPVARRLNPKAAKIIRRRAITKALDGDAAPVKKALSRSHSEAEARKAPGFDLIAATIELADDVEADNNDDSKVLSLRGCPRFVKVVFSDFQLEALNGGDCIPTGSGWAAAMDHGLHELTERPEVQLWMDEIATAKDDASNLPLATRVRLHRLIESPDFTVADPVGAGRESLSFRCPKPVVRELYEALRRVYLPGKTSSVALPCICWGLVDQLGVGEEASEHLARAFEDLVQMLEEATKDLEKIMRGFGDA